MTADGLAPLLASAPRAAVLLYAPWCQHSRAFLPRFDELAAVTFAADGTIALAKLDVTESEAAGALAQELGVHSYPALVLFRHGVPSRYRGDHTVEAVAQALNRMGDYLVRRLDTAADAAAFLDDGRVRVIATDPATGEDSDTAAALLALEEAAAALDERRVVFGIARTPEAARVTNLTAGRCALFKEWEEGRAVLPQPLTAGTPAASAQRLREWVSSHLRPALVALDPADKAALSELHNHNHVKLLLLLPPAPPSSGHRALEQEDEQALLAAVHQLVAPFRHKLLSYFVRPYDFEGFAAFLQLGAADALPTVMLFQSQRFELYRFAGPDWSEEEPAAVGAADGPALEAWLGRFWRRELAPVFKSQPPAPPVESPHSQVQRLSGESFESWAADRDRDALFVVVKAGCPHCTRFEATFASLAKELGEDSEAQGWAPLVFGAVDAVCKRGSPSFRLCRRRLTCACLHRQRSAGRRDGASAALSDATLPAAYV